MTIYDSTPEEQIQLLKNWLETNQKDLDEYQALVDKEMNKKRELEAKLQNRLRPILKRAATFQKFVDSFTNKKHQIQDYITKIENGEKLNID